MFIINWKPVFAEADADVGGTTSPPPPGPQGSSQQGGADLATELARSREENAALQREIREFRKGQAAAKKQKADDAAIAAGEADKVLKQRDEQLAAANARIEAMEKAAMDRLDASIKKLPEAAQKEIGLIRDGLPTDKLEKLIALKMETITSPATDDGTTKPKAPAPPAPSVSMRNQRQSKNHVHPETMQLFQRLSAPVEVVEMANNVFGRSIEQVMGPGDQFPQDFVGDHKFRLYGHVGQGTIDEVDQHDTSVWIQALRAISPPPKTREMLNAMQRMGESMATQ